MGRRDMRHSVKQQNRFQILFDGLKARPEELGDQGSAVSEPGHNIVAIGNVSKAANSEIIHQRPHLRTFDARISCHCLPVPSSVLRRATSTAGQCVLGQETTHPNNHRRSPDGSLSVSPRANGAAVFVHGDTLHLRFHPNRSLLDRRAGPAG